MTSHGQQREKSVDLSVIDISFPQTSEIDMTLDCRDSKEDVYPLPCQSYSASLGLLAFRCIFDILLTDTFIPGPVVDNDHVIPLG